jgi:hypothetical protein
MNETCLRRPTQRAPRQPRRQAAGANPAGAEPAGHPATNAGVGGWDSARFLELVLSYGSFPFSSLVLPSRR